MNDIKSTKIIKMYFPKQLEKFKQTQLKQTSIKDEFVKSKFADSTILKQNKMVDILSRHDYNNISKSLQKEDYWSDSVNFVAFNKKNNKIEKASFGVLNNKTSKVEVFEKNIDDFIDMYTRVTSNQMDLHPDKQFVYRNTFKDLLTYIAKNRLRE